MTCLDAALRYTMKQMHVFPVNGKRPYTRNGWKDATTDPSLVTEWWARWPDAGVAIACEPSKLVVVDLDGPDGIATFQQIAAGRDLGKPWLSRTPGGGMHLWFTATQDIPSMVAAWPNVDIRARGGYAVAPPSPHPNGGVYQWIEGRDPSVSAPALPEWLALELLHRKKLAAASPELEEVIPIGQRNHALASIAGSMRRKGLAPEEMMPTLLVVNEKRTQGHPLPVDEVRAIADSIGRYAPAEPLGVKVAAVPEAVRSSVSAATGPLEGCVAVFQKWLHLPDPSPLHMALAAVAANRMPGDPVWLMLVAPASSGKTEMLTAMSSLADVTFASTLTGEQALLSGTAKAKASEAGGKGGLLRRIGPEGILVFKDWSSILEMRPEKRLALLAAFREIYDGYWTRLIGEDGGRELFWQGKLGLVTACTYAIDSHQRAMAALGERFVYYRFSVDDEHAAIAKANANTGMEDTMRAELAGAVSVLFETLAAHDVPELTDGEREQLASIARVAVRLRSPVERDSYHRDIVAINPHESPMRLNKILHRLVKSLRWLGVEDAIPYAAKVALDSIPDDRLRCYAFLEEQAGTVTTKQTARALGFPTSTTRRLLEDLAAQRYVIRTEAGEGQRANADHWTPAAEFSTLYNTALNGYIVKWSRGDEVDLDTAGDDNRLPGDMAR